MRRVHQRYALASVTGDDNGRWPGQIRRNEVHRERPPAVVMVS